MAIDRRSFLKGLGGMALAVPAGLASPGVSRAAGAETNKEFAAILVDTTKCIGCQLCETMCADAAGMPIPDTGEESLKRIRKTSEEQLTVVNRFRVGEKEIFVKTQCMHCNQAGCVSACLVRAMIKQKEGPVTWETNCIGCRYCMIACPFDSPKFEYHRRESRIVKCDFCWERFRNGGIPVCVEVCPVGALTFGSRRELLHEGNKRIYGNNGQYFPHIYGQHEVGGTGYLYLASVPFDRIGFRTDLGTTPFPELTKSFLMNSVPIIHLLGPAFLIGLYSLTRETKDPRKK